MSFGHVLRIECLSGENLHIPYLVRSGASTANDWGTVDTNQAVAAVVANDQPTPLDQNMG